MKIKRLYDLLPEFVVVVAAFAVVVVAVAAAVASIAFFVVVAFVASAEVSYFEEVDLSYLIQSCAKVK